MKTKIKYLVSFISLIIYTSLNNVAAFTVFSTDAIEVELLASSSLGFSNTFQFDNKGTEGTARTYKLTSGAGSADNIGAELSYKISPVFKISFFYQQFRTFNNDLKKIEINASRLAMGNNISVGLDLSSSSNTFKMRNIADSAKVTNLELSSTLVLHNKLEVAYTLESWNIQTFCSYSKLNIRCSKNLFYLS